MITMVHMANGWYVVSMVTHSPELSDVQLGLGVWGVTNTNQLTLHPVFYLVPWELSRNCTDLRLMLARCPSCSAPALVYLAQHMYMARF